ncbi:MAG: alpha/beta hydrolase-fold protein [Erysipelotrichaceae bacterium]|nr:alpha/beta hydrolase-fold protein [Erysipelotrichaceae bacterium]
MIIKENIWIDPYKLNRTLHIYLPDNLEDGERLPVLYMFDGHNLFNDEDATYGTSWGIKDYLDQNNLRVMVVGLECSHEDNGRERLREFTPFTFDDEPWGHIEEKGISLINWMNTSLKKYIDNKYPTISDREHTYIGGSSMGGTMALYMAIMHSDIYSKAICVSPHIYPMYKDFKKILNHPMSPNTEVYISWGGWEYPEHYIFAVATDQNLQIIRALFKKPGVDVLPHCFKNDDHSEAAWRKELKVWMSELKIGQ